MSPFGKLATCRKFRQVHAEGAVNRNFRITALTTDIQLNAEIAGIAERQTKLRIAIDEIAANLKRETT